MQAHVPTLQTHTYIRTLREGKGMLFEHHDEYTNLPAWVSNKVSLAATLARLQLKILTQSQCSLMLQQSRTRARDLKGIHVNVNILQPGGLGGGFCYIAIWSLLKLTRKQDEALRLAISHQVDQISQHGRWVRKLILVESPDINLLVV